MKITIGSTELTVLGCYPYQYQSGKRELRVTLAQSEISYADLKALLASMTENEADIIRENDDGTSVTYVGYRVSYQITDKTLNDTEVFYVVIECVAEAERKALEATAKVTELENEISAQSMEIELLNETLLEVLMG